MPKTTKSGKAIEDELPSTLQRSGAEGQADIRGDVRLGHRPVRR